MAEIIARRIEQSSNIDDEYHVGMFISTSKSNFGITNRRRSLNILFSKTKVEESKPNFVTNHSRKSRVMKNLKNCPVTSARVRNSSMQIRIRVIIFGEIVTFMYPSKMGETKAKSFALAPH